MKAIVLKGYGGIENFQMEDVDDPVLTEGTVKVRLKAAGFNPIDYQMRKGGSESKLLRSPILGREMSGIIVKVHDRDSKFKAGDEVYSYVSNLGSNGAYAEYIVLPEEIVSIKPKTLNFNEAASIPVAGLTAIQTVERLSPASNDSVFISGGAGGVGSMVIRLLLHKGITRIFTTAGNADSREKILSYGIADKSIIDYKERGVAERLISLNGNHKFDFCIDTVGDSMSEICAEVLKVNGVYADVTFLATDSARAKLFNKGTTVVNVSNYAYGIEGDREKMKYYHNKLDLLKQQLDNKSLPLTTVKNIGKLSVETVREAHVLLESNQSNGNKLVMEID
jgi:NADPH:quinone reductase